MGWNPFIRISWWDVHPSPPGGKIVLINPWGEQLYYSARLRNAENTSKQMINSIWAKKTVPNSFFGNRMNILRVGNTHDRNRNDQDISCFLLFNIHAVHAKMGMSKWTAWLLMFSIWMDLGHVKPDFYKSSSVRHPMKVGEQYMLRPWDLQVSLVNWEKRHLAFFQPHLSMDGNSQ